MPEVITVVTIDNIGLALRPWCNQGFFGQYDRQWLIGSTNGNTVCVLLAYTEGSRKSLTTE